MAYAILRFAKHKGGTSKALSAHHERTKEVYDSNPDIDPSRTAQNIHLVTPRWYQRVTAMDAKLDNVENILSGINLLNAGKKREEAMEVLRQLLPEAESFEAETRRLQDMIASSRLEQRSQQQENAELRKALNKEHDRNFEQNVKISALAQRCKRAEKLLEKVPQEALELIKRRAITKER